MEIGDLQCCDEIMFDDYYRVNWFQVFPGLWKIILYLSIVDNNNMFFSYLFGIATEFLVDLDYFPLFLVSLDRK